MLTVVVTVYNKAMYVEECITSIFNQTMPPDKVVVVDDSSTDGSTKILEDLSTRFPLIILRNERNRGTAFSRNRGILHHQDDYYLLFDGDDRMLPEMCEKMLAGFEAMSKRKIGIVFCDYYRIDSNGNRLSRSSLDTYYDGRSHLLPYQQGNSLLPCIGFGMNPMIRREVFEKTGYYDESYQYAEDMHFYCQTEREFDFHIVDEPLFEFRESECQKTSYMRRGRNSRVISEPRRILRHYLPKGSIHPVGHLSRRGVLDIGLKCPHSCIFCYYSFLDGSDDQFTGMRKAPWRPLEECKRILGFIKAQGLQHVDITGGEPAYHPDIVDIVRYAEKNLDLRCRMITLGQLLHTQMGNREHLLDRLLDAGLTEFLFSIHAANAELHRKLTGGHLKFLLWAMDRLDGLDYAYCSNTVIVQDNYKSLPNIALLLTQHNIRIANFISMNAYFEWNERGEVFGIQARYSEVYPYLKEAVEICEKSGIGVNIRYGPYCSYKGLERNYVGIHGVSFDPHEWRNHLRIGEHLFVRSRMQAIAHGRGGLAGFHKVFDTRCINCTLQRICDGVDAKYVNQYGWEEFKPFEGEKKINDITHFRYDYPPVLYVKNEQFTTNPRYYWRAAVILRNSSSLWRRIGRRWHRFQWDMNALCVDVGKRVWPAVLTVKGKILPFHLRRYRSGVNSQTRTEL